MKNTVRVRTEVAARYLGMRPSTLEKWRVNGGGPPFMKIGGRVTYQMQDLEAWLNAHRFTSTREYPLEAPPDP